MDKKEKKDVYIKCPRCELNYCLKKDKICSVCKAELEGDKDTFSDDFELELCPICKTNYIQPDEIMCTSCLKERQENGTVDDDDEWNAYANREDNDDYISEEEETGDMASINDIDDDDVLGTDLVDDDLGFDLDDMGDGDDINAEDEEEDEEFKDDFEQSEDLDDFDEDEEETSRSTKKTKK